MLWYGPAASGDFRFLVVTHENLGLGDEVGVGLSLQGAKDRIDGARILHDDVEVSPAPD